MSAQFAVPYVDTNIIPARNAGIGSLLLDLRQPHDGPPVLATAFAFIDVGVSRAMAATTLKSLLANDLGMEVSYVATEIPGAVPYAYVTLPGERAEQIRQYLSGMISSKGIMREVIDWHYVVDQMGKVSSIAYSYDHYGNEIWESYFMGRTFMVSGEKIEFQDPVLEKLLSPDVKRIEAVVDLETKQDKDPGQPAPSPDGYAFEMNPLEAGLAEFGIALHKTAIPQRINEMQNILFIGNVLNHYPQDEQARAFDRITVEMQEGDIVIVQADDIEMPCIEVFNVKGYGSGKTFERILWVNTAKLEVRKPPNDQGSWQQIQLKPVLERIVNRLLECLERKLIYPHWNQKEHKVFIHQNINLVFGTFFRALPVEKTLRIAIREALRKLPSQEGLNGIPIFKEDHEDAFGNPLTLGLNPIIPEEDFIYMKMASSIGK